jgi:hypothetical protein
MALIFMSGGEGGLHLSEHVHCGLCVSSDVYGPPHCAALNIVVPKDDLQAEGYGQLA